MSEEKRIRSAEERKGWANGEPGAISLGSSPLYGGGLSYQATGWVLEFSESQLGARLVLHAIAYRLNNETGICYPSLETIAKECRMTKPGVIQAMDRLVESGELTIDRSEGGSGNSNRYSMPKFLEWWEQARQIKGKKGKPYYENGKAQEPETVNAIKGNGKPGLPEQEVEPSLEQKGVIANLPTLKEGVDSKVLEKYNERLEQGKQERKLRKANGRRNFQRNTALPVKIVTNKQPDSWIWFSTLFKRATDHNAFSRVDLWATLDVMIDQIGRDQVELRLSLFVDAADKVSGYLAKDFIEGGWMTVDPSETDMPRIVNEE